MNENLTLITLSLYENLVLVVDDISEFTYSVILDNTYSRFSWDESKRELAIGFIDWQNRRFAIQLLEDMRCQSEGL